MECHSVRPDSDMCRVIYIKIYSIAMNKFKNTEQRHNVPTKSDNIM